MGTKLFRIVPTVDVPEILCAVGLEPRSLRCHFRNNAVIKRTVADRSPSIVRLSLVLPSDVGTTALFGIACAVPRDCGSGSEGDEARESRPLRRIDTETRLARYLFIVARQHPELYEYLQDRFADDRDVVIILDRRHGERRQGPVAFDQPERRARQRRHRPDIDEELRAASHAIVMPDVG